MAVRSSTPLLQTDIQRTCGVQAQRAWSNETHRVEDDHSAGMAENGTTSYTQNLADSMTKATTREKLIKFGRALACEDRSSQTWATLHRDKR